MPQPELVHRVQQTLNQGGARLFELLPAQLRNVINQKLWLQCKDKNGNPFTSFEAFVAHRLPQGLESSIPDLENFCRRQPDVQTLIREQVQQAGTHGNRWSRDGHTISTKTVCLGLWKEGHYYVPKMQCDTCHREITDAAEAVVSWKFNANREQGPVNVLFTHKGECDRHQNECSMILDVFLVQLLHNVGMTEKKMKRAIVNAGMLNF